MLKALGPQLGTVGKWWDLLRVEASGEVFRSRGMGPDRRR